MKKIEATGLSGHTACGVCGEPLKCRVVVNGEIVEKGETVWHEAWATGPSMHLACCDERGGPIEAKRKSA